MSVVPRATCWMPSPWYRSRYSAIWLLSSELSLMGMRILPQGLVMALLLDVGGAQGHVLDALAVVQVQVFGDLALVVRALVDGDADLAAGAGHGLALRCRWCPGPRAGCPRRGTGPGIRRSGSCRQSSR